MTKWKWYVYILECGDGSYYTGCTWNTDARLEQHILGLGSKYTRNRGVRGLVYREEYDDLETARYRERQLKDWSPAKKQKLISGEWEFRWACS